MIARRTFAGCFALLMAGGLLTVSVAGAPVAAPGITPSPTPVPVATGTRVPEPSTSTTPTPGAVPTILQTPPSEPRAELPTPAARPTGVTGASVFPFVLPTPSPTQSYTTFVRNTTHLAGVIDLIRKDDDLYFDLRPDNFDKPYIILPSIAAGVGGGAFAGRVYDPLVVIFKRVGRRVMWITPNSRYVADTASAAASLAISVADSVIQTSPVVAEDSAKAHTVIAPQIFLSDFEGIGADLGRGVSAPSLPGLLLLISRPSFSVDSTKSYYLRTKAFARNDEISVNLAFNGPANALPTVPDGRGIPIHVHYSIVAPPDKDPLYVPRYADDRIGYFITARKRYGDDNASSPFDRFIERWNIASGPITFTLTNEIPPQYRDTVRRGILAWNDAFAKVGYPHAIVVNDPPTDSTFDPDDARYNTVRWITSDSPDFSAYSPHVSDPDNGQIIRAQVVIDGESLRSIRRGFTDRVLPVQRDRADAFQPAAMQNRIERASVADEAFDAQTCNIDDESADQAALGMSMLLASPHVTPSARDRYVQQWLYSTVMHEVGHTLGLRHNFEGSTAYTYAQLHDPAFTHAHGTTASVMDYTPANLAAPNERQADYFPTKLGVYDYWAIQYGYTKTTARSSFDELPTLRKIAARSTQPGLAYGTDEDAADPYAIDPHIQRFDLSSDALAYAREEYTINDDVAAKLTQHYRGDQRSYQDLRQTFVTTLNNELNASVIAAHYVGGVYTSRAHRGQNGAGLPFHAIPRAESRRAFSLIDRYVLSSQSFRYPPNLLNTVEPVRYGIHWNSGGLRRADFPIREVVGELQDSTISEMFNPYTMARIADQSLKERHPHDAMDLADLFAWTNAAVFDDLGKPVIAPLHRDLQRRFADLELEIAFLPAGAMGQLGLPRDIQSLARYNLREVRAKLDHAYGAATDVATRAHIDDLRSRIAAGLNPSVERSI